MRRNRTTTRSNGETSRSGRSRKNFWYVVLCVGMFLIGLAIPSPFFRGGLASMIGGDSYDIVDTTNMAVADGFYSGGIEKNSGARNGYGRYETKSGVVFEGNWKNDNLVFGTRTCQASVYTGRFDSKLNMNGFGIITYSDEYISSKQKQGAKDNEITVTYIGNWSTNAKNGIGRSMKKDGSMEFGNYSDDVFQKPDNAFYNTGGNVYGIDVSHFQKDINWNDLALYCDQNGNVYRQKPSNSKYMQPVFFAYFKATEGATIRDDMYNIRSTEAERHGIVKGAYHFLHLGSSIKDQLKNFLETVTWTSGDLPPALDVELENEIKKYGVEKLRDMTLKWLQEVEKKLGVRPVIYTRETIRNKYLNTSDFKKYDFWIARYSNNGPDNKDWQMWQLTEKGRMSGYDGYIDINMFRGNYEAFRNYLENVHSN